MWGCRTLRGLALAAPRPAAWQSAARWASHVKEEVTAVRKGAILLHQSTYVEVKEWQPCRSGRAAASYQITWEELDSGNEKKTKFGANTKMTKVEPDRVECQVMYFTGGGKEEKMVVLADEDYNEVEVPMARFYNHPDLPEGARVLLYKDNEAIVKVSVLR
mmetsp:Transcript_50023/g.112384  ORF Transcript_50023/g.112384 Transcript_50023/m.112384 type:complete len:161 (+) Transcript_50023:95-577(+)